MKNAILIFALMLISLISNGQIINFPDANFKNALVNSNCVDSDGDGIGDKDADENNDGEIDQYEAEKVKWINVSNNIISNLIGIEFFTELQAFYCSKNNLTSLDVSNLHALQYLDCSFNSLISLEVSNLDSLKGIACYFNQLISLDISYLPALYLLNCSYNKLTSIDYSNLPSLKELYCTDNLFTSLDLSNLSKIDHLNCSNNLLTSLDLSSLSNLKYLVCSSNRLTSIDVSNLTALRELICDDNQLTSITISNLPLLTSISCGRNRLTSLDLSNLPNLRYLYCYVNQLTSLDVSNLPSLGQFQCNHNQLTSLNVSNLPFLIELYCNDNQLTSLDVSKLPSLCKLVCNNNHLIFLNIKNGKFPSTFCKIQIDGNLLLKYLCCDEKIIDYYKDFLASFGFLNVEVNTYCSFDPSGIFSSILGNIKYDIDKNDCDDNDVTFSYNKMCIKSSNEKGYLLSGAGGNYEISLNSGSYTIKPELENPELFNITPEFLVINVSKTFKDTIIQDFCITPKGILKQVDLSIIPLTPPARPGFDASYKVVMTNTGNQVENGTLYFSYDETKMDFVSTDVNPSTQSDGLLSWNFTDLLPFETRYYNVTLNVNSPSETPPVNAGDELLITCNILDNVFLLKQEVVGSYDPNDKTCLEGKIITPEQVGEYVHYLIRFENTGNYAAENVVVKDVIDESTFDISTLQITDASHEAWARINGNIVEFIFENIQLPFDDATNDGYICFKIKTKPTLVLGNELKNEANIYFDYNLPILTNKTNTVVASLVGTDEAIGESDIEVFPNPVSDMLKFSDDDEILKVEIFDMSGRLVQVSSVVDGEVNVARLLSGMYQISIKTMDGTVNKKFSKL